MAAICDTCEWLSYDEDADEYVCTVDMDEDDYYRFMTGGQKICPCYRDGDEYAVVRHQM